MAAIIIRVVSSHLIFRSAHRPTRPQLAFNTALYAFETALAFAILQLICRLPGASDGHLLIAIWAGLTVATLAGSLIVSVAIACFEGRFVERLLGEMRTSIVFGPVGAALAALALAPALSARTRRINPAAARPQESWLAWRSETSLQSRSMPCSADS